MRDHRSGNCPTGHERQSGRQGARRKSAEPADTVTTGAARAQLSTEAHQQTGGNESRWRTTHLDGEASRVQLGQQHTGEDQAQQKGQPEGSAGSGGESNLLASFACVSIATHPARRDVVASISGVWPS